VSDWRGRVAVGAGLAVLAGFIVTLLYGHYAGRLLDWRRDVNAHAAAERRAAAREREREQARADSAADAGIDSPPLTPTETIR
jgi:hypothetical protein